jgi:transposase
MTDVTLKEQEWQKIKGFLAQEKRAYLGDESACRCFVEGVKWILRSGSQWRLLPERYGAWNSVYKRFNRWCKAGVWERMHAHFAQDPDWEWGMLDSTVVRAHPCAAGAEKKR